MTRRAVPQITAAPPAPVIVNGRPVVPAYLGTAQPVSTATQGSGHIRHVPDPDPQWDPVNKVWDPPRVNPWSTRWTVRQLPLPIHWGGSYYLGAPSAADSTQHQGANTHRWDAADGRGGPAWHSAYPFKPEVVGINHYLPDGEVLYHPRGVSLSSRYIQHLWLDWGSPRRPPFTWIVACCVASYPTRTYRHHILDAGRNPALVGGGGLTWADLADDHPLTEDLGYRTSLSADPHRLRWTTDVGGGADTVVRSRFDTSLRPRMLIAQLSATGARVGSFGPARRRLVRGQTSTSGEHRYYLLGRRNGILSQDAAANLLVFEIRYYDRILTADELADEYDQLSCTWRFHRYRRL